MESGKFFRQRELAFDRLDWGRIATIGGPLTCGAQDLVVLDVELAPSKGHNFHKHPKQEEVIYVVQGRVEQWLGEDKMILEKGDSVCIPADRVHASFNIGEEDAKLLAILGPAVGESGYEVEDVADQKPWANLR